MAIPRTNGFQCSNVATTVAGVEGLLPVRFDADKESLYQFLTTDPQGPRLPVKVWLVKPDGSSLFTGKGTLPDSVTPSSGSAKCDAYLWAKEKYLDTGKCDPACMGYYQDAYAEFSPRGVVAQKIPARSLHQGVPFLRMDCDLDHGNLDNAANQILKTVSPQKPDFRIFRSILWSPSEHEKLFDAVRAKNQDIEVVDPYTLFLLLKTHLGGK